MTNVPNLRFKDFSGDWETKKLGDITIKTGIKNKSNIDYEVYSISNKYGFIPQDEQFENSRLSELDKTLYQIVSKGEFAYNPARINVGSIGVLEEDKTVIVSSLYVCFKLLDKLDYRLFKTYFKTYKFNKDVIKNTEGSVREYLFYENFSRIKVHIPNIEEQEKIASFFSLIDKKIELQTEKVEELKNYKKGIMQKIFSQELRFKDGNGNEYPEWEKKKLGEFCYIQGGYAFKSDEFVDSGVPIIRITNVDSIVNVLKSQTVYSNEKKVEERFWVRNGDLLIAMSGATTGKTGKYTCNELAYLNQRVGKFVLKKGTNVYYPFLYAIVETLLFYQQLMSSLVAGAQPNISPKDIEGIKFKIPTIDEQKKISELFMSIDKKIEKEQGKLGSLNQYKKGLLQQMFI